MKTAKLLVIALVAISLSLASCGNRYKSAPEPVPGYIEQGK